MGVLAVAGPISGAGAAIWPTAATWPTGFQFASSNIPAPTQAGVSTSGCSTNSTSVGGATAGSTATTCGALLSFVGPAVGQVSSVMGPTIIGSTVLAPVSVSSGAVVNTGP
jgi:hypothetical protein